MSKNGKYTYGEHRYVTRVEDGMIVGRVSGNKEGAYWYQLTGRPYDPPYVGGFTSLDEAFKAMCEVLP